MSRSARRSGLAALRGRLGAPIATLTAVAFLATFVHPRTARAIENAQPEDTPNFSENSNAVQGGKDDASSKARATKSRKAPVSAKGSFGTSVAIQVQPGRLGMTPSLALSYDSSSVGESAVGVGWSFGTSSISRSTRLGFPKVEGPDASRVYRESAAIFTGPAGEMVPAVDGPTGASNLFQPMRESSPVRFERDVVNDGWIEHAPSGTKRYFGHDPFSARRGRIKNELGTHAWLLVREQDAHFNYISYEYHNASAAERANKLVAQRMPVLKRVEWGGTHPSQSSVFFVKTTIAPQSGPVNLLEGNTILEDKITKIEVGQIGGGGGDVVDWTYNLTYTTSETGKQLLRTVARAGDAPETTTFTYSAGAPAVGPRFVNEGPIADLDPIYTNDSTWFQELQWFQSPRSTPEMAAQAPGFRSGVKFIDIDGNGTTDAIYHATGVGTTSTHVLWTESFLQGLPGTGSAYLGAWTQPPLGNPAVPSVQPTTGLPFFPFPGSPNDGRWYRSDFTMSMLRDLTDIDGDGDADGIGLAHNVDVLAGKHTSQALMPTGHYEPMPGSLMEFRFVTNVARAGGVQHPAAQVVTNWPVGVDAHSRIVATWTGEFGQNTKYKAQPKADVQMPFADLNADGRVDAVLLKHREDGANYSPPGGPGAAFGVNHDALLRLYFGMESPEQGDVDDQPLLEEIRNIVNNDHALVLVDENFLLSHTAPGPRIRLWTTAARLRIPEVPADTPFVLFGGQGEMVPGGPIPIPEPQGPFVPKLPDEDPWWWPRVDPDGDVFVPLRDHYYLKGSFFGFHFFGGEFRPVPRVFLMGGGENRALEAEPAANESHFERSLQRILNLGSPSKCMTLQCAYPPHVNFNTFLLDANGDSLPDLVTAITPARLVNGAGPMTICLDGHDLFLNRGYTFETAQNETVTQQWSNRSDLTSALRRVANRDRSCAVPKPYINDEHVQFGALGAPRPEFPSAAMAPADLDGDGRVDLAIAYRHGTGGNTMTQAVYLNNGRGFVPAPGFALPSDVALAMNIFLPGENALPNGYFPRQGLADTARLVDLDGDGLVDIVRAGLCVRIDVQTKVCDPARWYRNAGTLPDRLERVDSTTGAWTTIEYAPPKSSNLTIPEGGIHPPATSRLVKKVRSAAGPLSAPQDFPVEEIRLSYENFVKDLVSNEAIGFEKVKAEFVNSFGVSTGESVFVTRTFDVRPEVLDAAGAVLPVRHPLKGALVSTVTESGGWTANDLVDYSAEVLGTGVRVRPRLEIHGDTSPSASSAWFAEQTLSFDVHGNPTEEVSGNWDGAAITPPEAARTTLTEYDESAPRLAGWQIGLVSRVRNLGYSEDIAGTPDPAHLLGEVTTSYYASGAVQSTTRVGIRGGACAGADDDTTSYDLFANGLVQVVHESNGRDRTTVLDAKKLHPASVTTSVARWVDGVPTGATTTMTVSFTTDLRTGKNTTVVDPNGSAMFSTFDSEGRLLEQRGPDNTVLETNVYNDVYGASTPLSTTTTITTDVGKTFQRKTQRDAEDHVLSVVEGAGTTAVPWSRKSKTRYDAFGRAVESYLPAIVATINDGALPASGPKDVTAYDGFDRPTLVTNADGTTTSTSYEPRATTEVNARSIATHRTFDAFGELVAVERNPGGAAGDTSSHSFVRDGRGEILQVIDGDGSVRRFERDAGGRLLHVTLPAAPGSPATQFSMCHDLDDGLVHLESAAGRVVDVTRDQLGRVVLSEASDLNGLFVATSQSYDDPLVAKGKGRLTRKVDESGAYNLTYDTYGRPSQITFAPSARAKAGATNVASAYGASFVYSVAGQLKTATVTTGLPKTAAIVYTRDVKGRPTMIESKVASTAKIMAVDVAHDADDRVTFVRYGNGTTGEWTFNPLNERLDRVAYKNAGGGVLAAVSYVYDPNGNPLEENREREGYPGVYSFKLHSYDSLDRVLQSISSSPAGYFVDDHTFSAGGNLLTAGGDAYAYASAVTSQAATQVVNATAGTQRDLAYDPDGYLATDSHINGDGSTSSRTLTFDPSGCMRSITRVDVPIAGPEQTSSSDYTCGLDGKVVGRATTKPDGSTSRRIDFAGLGEIRADEGVFVLRIPLSGAVSVEDARSLATGNRVTALSGYQANDVRGSVIASMALEDTSTLAKETEFDAWGRKLTDFSSTLSSPRRGFVGAEADEAVGTYSFGARTYDPTLRRWVSPDPLVGAAPELDEAIGDDLNLFAYTGNNPVRRTDVSGFLGDEIRKEARESKETMGALGFLTGLAQGIVPGLSAVPPPNAKDSPYSGTYYHNVSAGNAVGGALSLPAAGAFARASAGALTLKAAPTAVLTATASFAFAANVAVAGVAAQRNAAIAAAHPDRAPVTPTPNASTGGGAKSGTTARGKYVGSVPKAPTGAGKVAPGARDPNRRFSKGAITKALAAQGGKCAGCSKPLKPSKAIGHHIKRHADGGKTNDKNLAAVCNPCHKQVHKR